MADFKRVLISVPDHLLKEVDSIVSLEKTNRSEFVRDAMRLYLRERRRLELIGHMKHGYREMAGINMAITEMYLNADNEQQKKYEERLGELGKNW